MALTLRNVGREYDKDNGQTGLLAPSARGWYPAVLAATASRATVARFVPSRDMTISSIAFAVTTLGADVACDVGIYSSNLQTRHAVSTAATGRLNSTGIKNIALGAPYTVLARTVYYAAFSCDAASTAILVQANFSAGFGSLLFGSTVGVMEADFQASAHPLAATITSAGGSSACIVLALRES